MENKEIENNSDGILAIAVFLFFGGFLCGVLFVNNWKAPKVENQDFIDCINEIEDGVDFPIGWCGRAFDRYETK